MQIIISRNQIYKSDPLLFSSRTKAKRHRMDALKVSDMLNIGGWRKNIKSCIMKIK